MGAMEEEFEDQGPAGQLESAEGATLLGDGRSVPPDELAELVYDDLRRMAANFFRGEPDGATLQPTALVHEAYLRLADQTRTDWRGRAHFLAVAARTMRRVLVSAARARGAVKRGGELRRVTLQSSPGESLDVQVDILELEEALERLASIKPRFVEIVELRFFSGLTVEETAQVLGISEQQVFKDWKMARAYLRSFLDA
ncbi:MAG: ECF-type sigma factor [Planctomycetota bacterium]